MPESSTRRPVQNEVVAPVFATGMTRGLHKWVATALFALGSLWALIAQAFTAMSLAILFLASAIGLLGEVPRLLRSGEVRATIPIWTRLDYLGSKDPMAANRYLIVRKQQSPFHFYFYIFVYVILGIASVLWACFFIWHIVKP